MITDFILNNGMGRFFFAAENNVPEWFKEIQYSRTRLQRNEKDCFVSL